MIFKKHIDNFFPDIPHETKIEIQTGMKHPRHGQGLSTFSEVLSWAPNIFVMLYSLIEYTDKYRLVVSPQAHFTWKSSNNDHVKHLTNEWQSLVDGQAGRTAATALPLLNVELNNVFSKSNLNTCIYELCDRTDFITSVFNLIFSIDELFSDLNLARDSLGSSLGTCLVVRSIVLGTDYNISDNDKKYGCVCLKTSVPQTGLTINNLTHNLTVIKPAVMPKMIVNKVQKKGYDPKAYNVLFLPWPLEIPSSSFTKVVKPSVDMEGYFGLFDYHPTEDPKLTGFISAIISAIRKVGNIDVIVLPECAVNDKTFDSMKAILFEFFKESAPSLLSGVYGKDLGRDFSKNAARLAFIGETKSFDDLEQKKHHRWFLDRNQLRTYNLAGALDPGKKWWENIAIDRRNLIALHTSDGVKLCPLICEDLARQEPVAQSVRAIGPNLVISLLLDGPQLKGRWPGKYSAVLSDDPGASVLSVTPLGMSLRSTGAGDPPSRGVALWSEPGNGSETLYVEDEGIGILLELEVNQEAMWTIDGRKKMKSVLRKKYHSTILEQYPDTNITKLKNVLHKELNR
ncbi:hypothetical protein [Vibrio cyclitrophicus]|uniref:hypothetical protein n=1 Tax=Vibrio cyclitrophicus TaxID=47951 RepID=UPI001054F509|nr:hypothetical protein [Vibrio cyclitrophicus]